MYCGGHLGLQDDSEEYTFENMLIGFANLKNNYIVQCILRITICWKKVITLIVIILNIS